MIKVIKTDKAPKPIGPYSQAVQACNLIFISGQLPIDPQTGSMISGDIVVQTKQVLENIKNILEAGGGSLANVVKSTIFLSDLENFSEMNKVYAEYFADIFPSRSTVQVAKLFHGALLEIEVIAVK